MNGVSLKARKCSKLEKLVGDSHPRLGNLCNKMFSQEHEGSDNMVAERYVPNIVNPRKNGTLLKLINSNFTKHEKWADTLVGSADGWTLYLLNSECVLETGQDPWAKSNR